MWRPADETAVRDFADLVHRWDEHLRRDLSPFDRLPPEAEARGTLLRDPAPDGAIEAAEIRLGMKLPASYRAFLEVSNGACASTLGVERQDWGITHRNGFLAIDDVYRLATDEWGRGTIQIWTEHEIFTDPTGEVSPIGDTPVDVRYMSPLREAVVISEREQTMLDVLVPRHDGREAELWSLGHSEHVAYRSVDAMLRHMAARPSTRPREELREQYVEWARGGKNTIEVLLELGDPRAAALALAHLHDPDVSENRKHGWVRPLGLSRDPALIEDLRVLYANSRMYGLRLEILHARLMCRDPEVRVAIEAVAADPKDPGNAWATFALTRLDSYGPP